MNSPSDFWDALAPHHRVMEDNFFDLPSLRQILQGVTPPVLVVGAGQGLIVDALRKQGFECDGVDLNTEMIKYALLRRRLALIQADAKSLPFADGAYKTIIYATGVVDVMRDEAEIRMILNEAKRVADTSGNIFVALYKFSAATENFFSRFGLLRNNVLKFREVLRICRFSPVQTMSWVVKHGKLSYFQAALAALRLWAFSSWKEKRNAFRMQTLLGRTSQADALIHAAPARQAYRNEAEIRSLFARLAMPIMQWRTSSSCHMVRV